MRGPEADSTTAKERVSFDKIRSLRSLIFGARSKQFDALLPHIPTSNELTAIAKKLDKPSIDHVVLGRLVPPYMPITEQIIKKLRSYSEQGRNVVIYTDSSSADQLESLRDFGISLDTTCVDKPSLRGFEYICGRQKMDPAHTAVIGSSPVTDIPLVEEGENSFFSLNILVKPIPPQKKLIGSWGQYFRARFSHTINLATSGIVRLRNPNMLRGIDI